MAEIVNLNAVRKHAQRTKDRAQADANAAKFGRTKAEREVEKARAEAAAKALDDHRRETE